MAAHVAHLQAAQAMQLAQARAAGLIPQGLQLPGESLSVNFVVVVVVVVVAIVAVGPSQSRRTHSSNLQLPGEYQAPTSLYLIWTKTVYGFVPDVVSCVL